MNRNQRKLPPGRLKREDSDLRIKSTGRYKEEWRTDDGCVWSLAKKKGREVEELLAPRKSSPRSTRNRCSYVGPDQKSFGQLTDPGLFPNILTEQQVHALIPDPLLELRELKRVLCAGANTVENSSQYQSIEDDAVELQKVDNPEHGEKNILEEDAPSRNQVKPINISEVPRVRIIAEKFSRYKKNNVELRKLEEKVVCVEYDVFEQTALNSKPIQVMRAFFSITPVFDEKGKTLTVLPSTIKNKFKISVEDLNKLSEKEVEMIDGKIAENLPYLDDLRKILRRKHIDTNNNKNSLDLHTLYEIANMDLAFERDKNIITKEELQGVKDLILKNCKSSVYGINRRVIKPGGNLVDIANAVSNSIMTELLRERGV